jgi:hypothetical protein
MGGVGFKNKGSFEAACISSMAPREATFMTCNCLKQNASSK